MNEEEMIDGLVAESETFKIADKEFVVEPFDNEEWLQQQLTDYDEYNKEDVIIGTVLDKNKDEDSERSLEDWIKIASKMKQGFRIKFLAKINKVNGLDFIAEDEEILEMQQRMNRRS